MKSIGAAGANGGPQEPLLCALSLTLYWSAALLCSATNAALVGQGNLNAPIALFCGMLGALALAGAAPHALMLPPGNRITRAVALAGPLLYGIISLLLGDNASPGAAIAMTAGSGAAGASLGLTLACLGAYLSRSPKTKGQSSPAGPFWRARRRFWPWRPSSSPLAPRSCPASPSWPR